MYFFGRRVIVEQFEANFQVKDKDLDDWVAAPKIFCKKLKIIYIRKIINLLPIFIIVGKLFEIY